MPLLLPVLALAGCLGLQSFVPDDSGGGADTSDGGADSSTFGGMTYPQSVDFGEVELGEPASIDVVLSNNSGGNVTLNAINLDLPTSYTADYTSVPWVIGDGGQYVITLTFLPTSSGEANGNLTFGLEGVDGLATIPVTGAGAGQGDGGSGDGGGSTGDGGGGGDGGSSEGLFFSTMRLDFGTVNLGTPSTQNVTIINNESSSIEISSITTSDAVLTTAGISAPTTVGPGSSRTLQVTFTPTLEQTYTESVTVATSEGSTNIMATGIGQYVCSICAPQISVDVGTSMDFVSVLGIPDTQPVRISNTGDEDLDIASVSMTNDSVGGGTFSVTGGGATTVAPGSSTSFSVTYVCPDAVCLDTPNETFDWNRIHIVSNDPANPNWVIGLNGI